MSKLSNEIEMIKLLQNRKYSIKELSNILEVSERMIRTYKSDIELSGFIVISTYGVNGGYEIVNNKSDFLLINNKYKQLYIDIDKCIKNKIKVKIEYKSKNSITSRIIYPLAIYKNMIVSFCTLRNDIRAFEFHRIINYEILKETF